jgi:hypothetical protein
MKQKRYLKGMWKLENRGAIMFSLLGLWEQIKQEKVARGDGFLLRVITKTAQVLVVPMYVLKTVL